jgi:hypothetical protein
MAFNYRMDKVKKLPTGQAYSVPCGMDTICYASEKSYNIFKCVRDTRTQLGENEVFLHSKWDKEKKDFVIYAISYQECNPNISNKEFIYTYLL